MTDTIIPDLTTQLAGHDLLSPLVLAASPWGEDALSYAETGIGALTMNSIGPHPRVGHPEPTLHDWGQGLINAVGLANPGAEAAIEGLQAIQTELQQQSVMFIPSFFADTVQGYADVATQVAKLNPAMVEVNISCPNVEDEFGSPFATDRVAAAEATAAARSVLGCPMSVKLAPNVPNIIQIAEHVKQAGADMLTVSNTMPGMVIDVHSRRPILSNRSGGVSGDAIRPIAIKLVYDLYAAFGDELPIIGTGGVMRGVDVIEMILAGAQAVGLASVAHRYGAAGLRRVVSELDVWLSKQGVASVMSLRGVAHDQ